MAHTEQFEEEVAHRAADFINRESNRKSLITVTRAQFSKNGRSVTVFVSVLPESYETQAIVFLKRMRSTFRDFLKKTTRFKIIPIVDFEIDFGEKHRRRLDELSEA